MPESPYKAFIQEHLNYTLTETGFTELGEKAITDTYIGKVRDVYTRGEGNDKDIVLVTTDRQSAFDRILAAIPFKGQVLNQISAFWFEQTKDLAPNHVVSMPDPNVLIAKPTTVFPVEFVVRGYITGVTGTSIWKAYEKGDREFCGNILPDGLGKNQQLPEIIITPTTKSDEHDEAISPAKIIERGLMTQEDWDTCAGYALAIFKRGQEIAAKNGMILVDTKYEFGKTAEGEILLIDEVHTPDSSRYWLANTYEQRMQEGSEPDNIDKEFLRLWFVDHCDPYNDPELPAAPDELVVELSSRYISLYEAITGRTFEFPDTNTAIAQRIAANVK